MPPASAARASSPAPLQDRAIDNLQFIRDTMERAGSFTAMPGWGGVVIGLTALAASVVAASQPGFDRWMLVWLVEAGVAIGISILAVRRKSARAGLAFWSGPGRRFALNFAPPVLVGAILTVVLYRAGLASAIPGTWLLLYGTGIMVGGAFSVPLVPAYGLALMVTGTVALFAPAAWRDYFMAFGFGLLQVIAGAVIARRYGG